MTYFKNDFRHAISRIKMAVKSWNINKATALPTNMKLKLFVNFFMLIIYNAIIFSLLTIILDNFRLLISKGDFKLSIFTLSFKNYINYQNPRKSCQ